MQTSVVRILDPSLPLAAAVYNSKTASREVPRSIRNFQAQCVRNEVKQAEKKLPLPLSTPLAALAAILSFPAHALAQTYDELVGKVDSAAADVSNFSPSFDVDLSGIDLSGIDPTLVAGGVGAVLLPTTLFKIFGSKGYSGDVSAVEAFSLLEEGGGVLLDVRTKNDRKESGSPSLKPLKLKVVSVPYEVEDGEFLNVDGDFAEKVLALKGIMVENEVIVLDKFGQTSANAAKILAKAGFTKVYAVKGGAEGKNGWKESELPWDEPGGFKLDLSFSGLSEAFSASTEDKGSLITAGLGLLAAAGFSAIVVTEAEVILQLLGSVALIQVALKKLLFAKDRKKTLAELRAFVDNQVAPGSLLQDIKEIGTALLPDPQQVKSAVEGVVEKVEEVVGEVLPDPSTISNAVEEAADNPASVTEKVTDKVEKVVEKVSDEVSDVVSDKDTSKDTGKDTNKDTDKKTDKVPSQSSPASKTALSASTDFPPPPRPLSPYASYPELKPPTSPMPKANTTQLESPKPASEKPSTGSEKLPIASEKPSAGSEKPSASSTDFPPSSKPLSPYASYPDLKPPSSPTPKGPVVKSESSAPAPASDPVEKAKAAVSSTDFPPPPRPLSPYASYPDLKPPTTPSPSPP